MTIRTLFLTAAALGLMAACNPTETKPAPETPPPADIAAPAPPSGPAAENTPDSLSSTPPTDAATPAPAATPTPAPATPAPAPAAGPTKAELDNGRSVYAQSCAMCHGPTGAGTQMGVALTAGHEYAAIKEKVTKGMINPGDKMPPMGAALTPDQLDDLSKFVEAGLPQ